MNRILRWVGAATAALVMAACGGGGGGGESSGPAPQPNPPTATAPTALIRAAAAGATAGSPLVLQTRLGSTVSLDGSGSVAGSGTVQAYAWTVTTRPAGSTAALTSATSAKAGFVPDVVGDYVLTLRVTDGAGSAEVALNMTVAAAVPSPTVVTSVEFGGPLETRPTRALSLGSSITLDASATADASAGATTLAWTLVSKPAGSTLTVPDSGARIQFVPDLAGLYTVRVRATTAAGSIADVVQSFDAVANAPAVAVATSIGSNVDSRTLRVALGNVVSLNANWGYFGSNYSASWAMESQPAGSSVPPLVTSNATATSFVPDVPGTYNAVVTVRDNSTGLTMSSKVVVIANWGPTAIVTGSAAPVAAVNGPSFVSATGAAVTLRGAGSNDPSGAALTYKWRIVTAPLGNTATLADDTSASTSFTPNVNGTYLLELVVTNADGYTALQQATVYVGNYPPVAAVDRAEITVLVGKPVSATAATSYSRSGNALSYSWALDALPAGSASTIVSPSQAALAFTPDVAGSYTASVTVNDGSFSAVATVTVTALAPSAGTVPLTYTPLQSRYSTSLDKLVVVSAAPNELHLVDVAAGTDTTIALPTTVKALSLSPNGRYAATLHAGTVSLLDLSTAQLLRSMLTGGAQTDVAVSDTGMLYLVGSDSYSSYNSVTVINGLTGARIQDFNSGYYGTSTMRVVYVASLNKIIYVQDNYLSTVYSATADPSTGLLSNSVSVSNSSSSGYYASTSLWLSSDERLLFLPGGAYVGTGDLRWVNTLGVGLLSVSHSASADEAISLTSASDYSGTRYPSSARRYAGSLLFPSGEFTLPKVGGAQAYGMAVFHAADHQRVFIVQTGSATPLAQGLAYYAIKP